MKLNKLFLFLVIFLLISSVYAQVEPYAFSLPEFEPIPQREFNPEIFSVGFIGGTEGPSTTTPGGKIDIYLDAISISSNRCSDAALVLRLYNPSGTLHQGVGVTSASVGLGSKVTGSLRFYVPVGSSSVGTWTAKSLLKCLSTGETMSLIEFKNFVVVDPQATTCIEEFIGNDFCDPAESLNQVLRDYRTCPSSILQPRVVQRCSGTQVCQVDRCISIDQPVSADDAPRQCALVSGTICGQNYECALNDLAPNIPNCCLRSCYGIPGTEAEGVLYEGAQPTAITQSGNVVCTKKLDEKCNSDNDCEIGLICRAFGSIGGSECKKPLAISGLFNLEANRVNEHNLVCENPSVVNSINNINDPQTSSAGKPIQDVCSQMKGIAEECSIKAGITFDPFDFDDSKPSNECKSGWCADSDDSKFFLFGVGFSDKGKCAEAGLKGDLSTKIQGAQPHPDAIKCGTAEPSVSVAEKINKVLEELGGAVSGKVSGKDSLLDKLGSSVSGDSSKDNTGLGMLIILAAVVIIAVISRSGKK